MLTRTDRPSLCCAREQGVIYFVPICDSVCTWGIFTLEFQLRRQFFRDPLSVQREIQYLAYRRLSLMRNITAVRSEVAFAATEAVGPRKTMVALEMLPNTASILGPF